MRLSPEQLRRRENQIFVQLERDHECRGRLYRDGVPSPDIYCRQPLRILFAFREPNMKNEPYALDMRKEVSDPALRPLRNGRRIPHSPTCWWNAKAGLFAHAVAAVIDGESEGAAYERFDDLVKHGRWNHGVLNRFAYMQIKKIGGGGTSRTAEIERFAKKHFLVLRKQVDLYRPHVVIGCGTWGGSPARLLKTLVLRGGEEHKTKKTGAAYWHYGANEFPRVLIEQYHPSARKSPTDLYWDVWWSIREVVELVKTEC
jgi:hypothetical protein